jgi:hypothetical protein
MLKTPIIFLIFKRPEETARVWETIRAAKPSKLFIVADGPRNPEEKKSTDAARAVVEHIDWPCKVERNYAEKNLGCRQRVWSGIDWAMSRLTEETDCAIILEDDCLPDASFFPYCEENLEKYKNNPQIMQISGVNFQDGLIIKESYYFSHIAQIWGWATWKCAWKRYDGMLASWPKIKGSEAIRSVFPSRIAYHYWAHMFDRMERSEMDTWDVAWTYTVFKEHGLCIMPKVNLVENIGSTGATHKASHFMHQETSPLSFPLVHPSEIKANDAADLHTYAKIYGIRNSFRLAVSSWVKDKLPFLFKHVQRLVK